MFLIWLAIRSIGIPGNAWAVVRVRAVKDLLFFNQIAEVFAIVLLVLLAFLFILYEHEHSSLGRFQRIEECDVFLVHVSSFAFG